MTGPERVLSDLTKQHNKLAIAFQQASQQQQAIIARQSAKAFQDLLIKITAETYRGASAYTQLVMAGGYAVFFTVWNGLRDELPLWSLGWSALFVGLSACVFVFFEVFKGSTALSQLKTSRERIERLTRPEVISNPEKLQAEVERYKLEADRQLVRSSRAWAWAFWPSTILGLTGVALLCIGIGILLWQQVITPAAY